MPNPRSITSPLEGEVGAEGAGRGVIESSILRARRPAESLLPPSLTLLLKGGGNLLRLGARFQ